MEPEIRDLIKRVIKVFAQTTGMKAARHAGAIKGKKELSRRSGTDRTSGYALGFCRSGQKESDPRHGGYGKGPSYSASARCLFWSPSM